MFSQFSLRTAAGSKILYKNDCVARHWILSTELNLQDKDWDTQSKIWQDGHKANDKWGRSWQEGRQGQDKQEHASTKTTTEPRARKGTRWGTYTWQEIATRTGTRKKRNCIEDQGQTRGNGQEKRQKQVYFIPARRRLHSLAESIPGLLKGTVLRDRFQKCWRKLTDLDLNKGRGWLLNFSEAPLIFGWNKTYSFR